MFESLDYKTGSAPWLFKSFSQSLLLNSLKKVGGEKDVIISPELIQPLDLLVSFSKLKECGVQKAYRLLDGDCEGSVQKRIFLVNNHASIANMIANKINAERSVRPETQFWVFSVPRTTRICKLIFEEQGILGDIQCIDFPLSFIPLDSDLFSLEQDSIYPEFFLRKNFSPVSNIAKALEQIGLIFGTASRVTGIGKLSTMALKTNETLYKETVDSGSSYEHLIVIDRDLDYHSLLLSSLNYQGLLDESFGIRCSRIDIPDSLAQKIQVRKYNAQSVDPIFKLIRDSHLSLASSNLKKIASEMSDNPLKSKDMSISQMREFVQTELRNRKALQTSLRLHISLCEIIMEKKKELEFASQLVLERSIFCGKDYKESVGSIESMIERQLDPIHCLRTLVLLSCCNDGLPSRDYANLVRLFLQSFGHQYLIAFHNLSKLNLLVRQPSPTNFLASPTSSVTGVISQTRVLSALPRRIHFRNMVRRFSLSPIENDTSTSSSASKQFVHKDAGSVFGDTYIPIIYRVTEMVTNNSHNSITEQLNELSKYTFHRESSDVIPKTKCIVIFFTAGVSYAEISALRHLSLQMKKDIIILTTNIINGCSFISNMTQVKSS